VPIRNRDPQTMEDPLLVITGIQGGSKGGNSHRHKVGVTLAQNVVMLKHSDRL
jgi:hypothetical protein